MRTNWPITQLTFAHWLSLPEPRNPKDQNGFAQKFGTTKVTLSRWKTDPEFQHLVTALTFHRLKQELPKMLKLWVCFPPG